MINVEHLILTTVVKVAEWRADTSAVLAYAHQQLHQRAQQSGLRIDGEPHADVDYIANAERVRVTLSVEATPLGEGDCKAQRLKVD